MMDRLRKLASGLLNIPYEEGYEVPDECMTERRACPDRRGDVLKRDLLDHFKAIRRPVGYMERNPLPRRRADRGQM
jgi:hypothetical protein